MLTYIREEIETDTVTVRDFNTPLISVDKSSRQKANKKTQALYDTLHQKFSIYITGQKKKIY